MKKIRVALVGSGGSIAGTYRKVFERMEDRVEAVACIDASGKDPHQWNVPLFEDWGAFQASGIKADAVEILTPPESHVQLALAALQRGYHVLVEKPAAFTETACQRMIAAAKEGQTLFFSQHAIYAAGIAFLKDALRGAAVRSAVVTYLENVADYRQPGHTSFSPGAAWDSGTNAMSVLFHVAPALATSRVLSSNLVHDARVGDIGQVFAEFAWEGGSGLLMQNWTIPDNTVRVLDITTDTDRYVLDIDKQQLAVNGTVVEGPNPGAYLREYQGVQEHFLDCIGTATSYTPVEPVRFIAHLHAKAGAAHG